MTKRILLFCLLCTTILTLRAQDQPTILHANHEVLSIRDGDEMRKDYWTISPEYKLDVYTADKTPRSKTVTFISDIDSISFLLHPGAHHDFVVLWNGKDSCFTRLASGITPAAPGDLVPHSDTIPFTLTEYNNISVQSILNGTDTVNLMFHSANSSVVLTEAATARLKSVEMKAAGEASSWGGRGSMRASRDNQLQIGPLRWEHLNLMEDRHSGHQTDGKFGPDLFPNKVLELNFDQHILVVHNTLPEIGPEFTQLNLEFKQISMFVTGALSLGDEQIMHQFLLHSGYSGAVLLDDGFVAEHQIGEQLETQKESELKDSFGNVLKTKHVALPGFDLAGTTFTGAPAAFFDGAIGRRKMSIVGGEIIKRFNMLIDLRNAYIYLKPNENADLPFGDA